MHAEYLPGSLVLKMQSFSQCCVGAEIKFNRFFGSFILNAYIYKSASFLLSVLY